MIDKKQKKLSPAFRRRQRIAFSVLNKSGENENHKKAGSFRKKVHFSTIE